MRPLAVPRIRSERASVKLQVVGGVVAVDVGVFENVRLYAQNTEMANGALNHLRMSNTEGFSKLRPSVNGVEWLDRVRNAHVRS